MDFSGYVAVRSKDTSVQLVAMTSDGSVIRFENSGGEIFVTTQDRQNDITVISLLPDEVAGFIDRLVQVMELAHRKGLN